MADLNEWDFSYSWRIEDFSLWNTKVDDSLFTPYFTFEAFENSRWYLTIEIEYSPEKIETLVYSLVECSGNEYSEESSVSYKIEVLNESKKILGIYNDEKKFENKSIKYFSVKREEFLEDLKSCGLDAVTIHCHMKRTDETKRLAQKGEIRTRISTEKSYFDWRVQLNKTSMTVDGTRYFCLRDTIYSLKVAFRRNVMIISVSKLSKNSSGFHCIYGTITLLNVERRIAFTTDSSFDTDDQFSDFPSIITKEQLQDKLNELVIDGKIVFQCEFCVLLEEETTNTSSPIPDTVVSRKSVSDMCGIFRDLLDSKKLSDVKLRANNELLEAHKCVLAARSPVFSAMFEQDMVESNTGIVDIVDVDADTLKSFLRFLYAGELDDLDYERASKLLLVADKYQVPSLKEEYGDILIASISVENVCELLQLADRWQHDTLKNACVAFIARHAAEIFHSPNWQHFMKGNINLCNEVLLYIGQHCSIRHND